MSFFRSIPLVAIIIASVNLVAQEDQKNFTQDVLSHLSGSLESNLQWYNNDPEFLEVDYEDEYLRSNSYLRLDYEFLNNFTAGLQLESYEPMALLNYYKGTNAALNTKHLYAGNKSEVSATPTHQPALLKSP